MDRPQDTRALIEASARLGRAVVSRVLRKMESDWSARGPGSSLCLFAKRLEKAQFCWPRIGHARVQLNAAQLLALVDGLDWKKVRPVEVKRKRVGHPA
jgi:hypothetical protein